MFGKRLSRALALTTVATLVITVAAFADNVNNDVQSTYGSENVAYTAGAAALPVSFWIVDNNSGGQSGCDAADGSAVTLTISAPADVIVSPASRIFSACGEANAQSFSFSTLATATAGSRDIDVVAQDSTGNYNVNGAAFHLVVSAPAATNAQPQIAADATSVTVDEGSEATMTGTWSDANAGNTVSLSASVGTIVKAGTNAAGTWSWSHTPGDNTAGTTVTITADDGTGSANATNTASFTLIANNVAPSKTADSFSFNPYSGLANASVSFSDPGWLDVVSSDFSGIADSATASFGPAASGPLTGTFSTSQTYTGCISDAISVRVSDDDGDYFDHTFAAADTLGRYTATFKAPLKDGYRNIAKLGNVIPVKIQVLDCHGLPVTDRTLTIRLIKGDTTDETEAGAVVLDATSVSAADTDNVMRLADGFYIYNLATKGLATGTPFTILVKDGSYLVNSALIELKK